MSRARVVLFVGNFSCTMHKHNLAVVLGACCLLASVACYRVPAQSPTVTAPVSVVVHLQKGWPDSARALTIVVRDADQPDRPLESAIVSIAHSATEPLRSPISSVTTTGDGEATLVGIDGGEYRISARRIGYTPFTFDVRLRPNCQNVIEIYLGQAVLCLFDCPSTPPRAVLTTCRDSA